ncbi:MAG: hypothetical protein JRJ86_03625 [Deltaproteobacteria bacterium]|nr:hypothetical protein [Deltaproteobacteria bacterium]MBW2117772.1 hypothetical protein [Deltaproteobacteria bacterium]MBW2343349.1 hypothetical protein [Deltaproteobacteria bacterium]
MKVNCQDHRKSMELLGLQMRLRKGIANPKEQKEVEKQIKALEKELRMN